MMVSWRANSVDIIIKSNLVILNAILNATAFNLYETLMEPQWLNCSSGFKSRTSIKNLEPIF
jgi:hypothetical protein